MIWLSLWLAAAPPLPEQVVLKTWERQFTSQYDLALFEGRIYWKPLASKEWALLPPAGLPVDKSFKTPGTLAEISADGDNLVAIDASGRVYYAKLDTLKWTADWGPWLMTGPLYIDQAAGERIAMSHRKMAFEDIDQNRHDIIVGVTTLYVLAQGGRRLEYTDPWLPPGKRHFMCLPEHGRFRAAAVSASASTLFVIDAGGRSYTRLADFDTLGLDPVLRYGWDRDRRSGLLNSDVYSLPAHQWVAQPPLPGPGTTAITVHQTGQGNEARELRVGASDGYWKKPISAGAWEKVLVDHPPVGNPLDPASETWSAAHTQRLTSSIGGSPATLENFAPDCPPATLTVDGRTLPLHFLQDWEPGRTQLTGALFSDGSAHPLFHGRPMIEVELLLDGRQVTLRERFRPRSIALEATFEPIH